MAQARWLAPWKDSEKKAAIYHVVSRVVERRFAFGPEEKEKFRTFMRMIESFSGCRLLSYCIMSNHFHMLLEVPPMPKEGLDDEEFFKRLRVLYSTARVAEIRRELETAREEGWKAEELKIFERYTYRMHDLSQFMKGLLQRFTQWFNRKEERSGTLWERRFKSVLVEDGVAARTMAAYIDLNPVRAGICEDPAEYRWSSYAEAVAGGQKARAGLVRALHGHRGNGGSARGWAQGGIGKEYRRILLGKGTEVLVDGEVKRRGMEKVRAAEELAALEEGDLAISRVIRHRVRYFSDGLAIGGRQFVDEFFVGCRERFGSRRKDGARKPRGALAGMAGKVWAARDLRVGVG